MKSKNIFDKKKEVKIKLWRREIDLEIINNLT
jgi:hypothetical protein